MKTQTLRFLLLIALVFSLLTPTTPAHAAGLAVNSLLDTVAVDGNCTLREAIINANNNAATNADCAAGSGWDVITFSVSGTITLASALPTITAAGGELTINGSGQTITISGNNTVHALSVVSSASLILNSLTIANSSSATSAGGIYSAGTLTITDSTFSDNSAGAAAGGGISNVSGTLTVTNSTFSGNSAGSAGGGIYTNGGTATITNSTFSGNSASTGGGGIYIGGGTLTITNSTFSGNSASTGGGIARGSAGTVTLRNTIVANSTSGGDCSGTVTDGGNNIVEDNTCGFSGGADPNLGALTGSPAYFPLNSGSPAIDAGDDTVCANPPVNNESQNGVTRPQGAHCDIGSFELGRAIVVNS